MPIQVVRDDEQTFRMIYQGDWTWDEFYLSNDEASRILDESTIILDQIVDLRESGSIPKGALPHLTKIKYMDHPQLGLTVLVGANFFIQVMVKMMKSIKPDMGEALHLESSMEDARAYLASHRTSKNS